MFDIMHSGWPTGKTLNVAIIMILFHTLHKEHVRMASEKTQIINIIYKDGCYLLQRGMAPDICHHLLADLLLCVHLICWLNPLEHPILPFECEGIPEGPKRTLSSLPPSLCLKVRVTSVAPMHVCAHEAQMLFSSLDLTSQGQICTSGYFIVTAHTQILNIPSRAWDLLASPRLSAAKPDSLPFPPLSPLLSLSHQESPC